MLELSPGVLFAGRFRIESLLGTGGHGRVYVAHHEVLQRSFALKLIGPRTISDPTTASRFRREVRAAARIENAHVVYIHDFGISDEGVPYIAMEHVPGTTLALSLQSGPLAVPRVLSILGQIAEALIAAHACDVVHRDLKPGNVMLMSQQGQPDFVKVLDFGLAHFLNQSAGTTSRERAGTPYYLSPEQVSDAPVDFRSDIYSAGVVAFEMLSGTVPFSGNLMDVLKAHVVRMPPSPSRLAKRRDIPAALEGLVMRCLAKSPEDRFPNAVSLAAEVQTLQLGLGTRPVGQWPGSSVESTRTRSFARKLSDLEHTDPEQKAPLPDALTPAEGWKDLTTDVEPPPSKAVAALASWRNLSELAYAVRDRKLGGPGISEELSLLIVAEGRLDEVANQIGILESEAAAVEIYGKMREARLGQLLSQLEHEHAELLDTGQDDMRTTIPMGATRQHDDVWAQAGRIEKLAREVQQVIQRTGRQWRARVTEIDAKRAELEEIANSLHLATEPIAARLVALLRQVRRQVGSGADAELLALFQNASIG
jgi:serine/threonine protein kinase